MTSAASPTDPTHPGAPPAFTPADGAPMEDLLATVRDAEQSFWQLVDAMIGGRLLQRTHLSTLASWLEQLGWPALEAYERILSRGPAALLAAAIPA